MLLKPLSGDPHVIIEHDGLSMNLKEWSKYLGLPFDTLRMRYRRGLRGDELFKQARPYQK